MFVIALIAAFVFGHVSHWDGEPKAATGEASLVVTGHGHADGDNDHRGAPGHGSTFHDCPITQYSPSFLAAAAGFESRDLMPRKFGYLFDLREVYSLSLTCDPPVPRFFS
jgi:hypothetical protein